MELRPPFVYSQLQLALQDVKNSQPTTYIYLNAQVALCHATSHWLTPKEICHRYPVLKLPNWKAPGEFVDPNISVGSLHH